MLSPRLFIYMKYCPGRLIGSDIKYDLSFVYLINSEWYLFRPIDILNPIRLQNINTNDIIDNI